MTKQSVKKHTLGSFKCQRKGIANRIFKLFQQNPTTKIKKPTIQNDSIKVSEAKAWLTRYFNRIGDSMPHMDKSTSPMV